MLQGTMSVFKQISQMEGQNTTLLCVSDSYTACQKLLRLSPTGVDFLIE